jgi:hypothetical protein
MSGNILWPGEELRMGDILWSPNGMYSFSGYQYGDFILAGPPGYGEYGDPVLNMIWHTNTDHYIPLETIDDAKFVNHGDGFFGVMVHNTQPSAWEDEWQRVKTWRTYGKTPIEGGYLELRDDGQLEMYVQGNCAAPYANFGRELSHDVQSIGHGSGDYSLVQNISVASGQDDWRWCCNCQLLFFAGAGSMGKCHAGGEHQSCWSGNYSLVMTVGQIHWRWCRNCQGLFFAPDGSANGVCPVGGGTHDSSGSGNYSIVRNMPGASGQDDWRWCKNCQGLFFAPEATSNGVCPVKDDVGNPLRHDSIGSGDYNLVLDDPGFGQNNWRWCKNCQGLFFAPDGSANGVCPVGGAHDPSESGNYSLMPVLDGQNDWRWCKKCQGLFFAGKDSNWGHCYDGDRHDPSKSGDYILEKGVISHQCGWRWCKWCQGLFFSGNPRLVWRSGDWSAPEEGW